MDNLSMISSEDTVKILGDPTRIYILKRLIHEPLTITVLGHETGKHPALIRQHILKLQQHGLVEFYKLVDNAKYKEKFYRATARAFFVNLSIFSLAKTFRPELTLGSDDLALAHLNRSMSREPNVFPLHIVSVGSLDGLIYLRNGFCRIAGCHLYDPEGENGNIRAIRMLFSNHRPLLVTVSTRMQGLFIAKGNPKGIRGLADLERADVSLINRKNGAGTRQLLDAELRRLEIDPDKINGYATCVDSHMEAAQAVREGAADVALGIYAAAKSADLDFIPLHEELYQLAMTPEVFAEPIGQALIDTVRSADFQREIRAFGGYGTDHCGEVVEISG